MARAGKLVARAGQLVAYCPTPNSSKHDLRKVSVCLDTFARVQFFTKIWGGKIFKQYRKNRLKWMASGQKWSERPRASILDDFFGTFF